MGTRNSMRRARIRDAITSASWSTLGVIVAVSRFVLRLLLAIGAALIIAATLAIIVYLMLRVLSPDTAAAHRATFWDQVDTFRSWVITHDQRLDEITVWSFFVGLGLIATVELITFMVMFGTKDETPLGASLRTKKIGYALIMSALSILYGMTLMAYYHDRQFNIWERLGIRLLGIIGIFVAVPCAIIFVCILVYQQHRSAPALLQGTSHDLQHTHTDQGSSVRVTRADR
jgi:hypothetical protein